MRFERPKPAAFARDLVVRGIVTQLVMVVAYPSAMPDTCWHSRPRGTLRYAKVRLAANPISRNDFCSQAKSLRRV